MAEWSNASGLSLPLIRRKNTVLNVLHLTDRDRGWLEGVLDSEGYIGVYKINDKRKPSGFYWRRRIEVSNTCLPFMEKICEILNIPKNKIRIKKNYWNKKRGKNIYRLEIPVKIAKEILPELKLIVKEKQRRLYLESCKYRRKDKELENIKTAFHQLNQKNKH